MDKLNNLKQLLNVHNLSDVEYKQIIKILKREPNLLELGIYSVMWSEHCSYKSSKKWLKKLPYTFLFEKILPSGQKYHSCPV